VEEYVNGRGNAGVSAREYGHKEETPSDKSMVLVVDDEPSIRRFCAAAASRRGYPVYTVSSAEQCLEFLSTAFDTVGLILLDIDLPGRSGLDILDDIYVFCPSVPVVMMSGSCGHQLRLAAERNEYADFLAKPFSLSDLQNVFDSYMAAGSPAAVRLRYADQTKA